MMLMKAKINFTATVVGNHPNVIKFIGAVVEDHASESHPVKLSSKDKPTTKTITNLNAFSLENAARNTIIYDSQCINKTLVTNGFRSAYEVII